MTKDTYYPNAGASFEYDAISTCPFCDSSARIIFIGNDYTKKRKITIKCNGCQVERTTGAIRNSLEWCAKTGIDTWNKRASLVNDSPKWVPVSERLPEERTWVLTFGHDYRLCKYESLISNITGSASSFRDTRGYEIYVTHFMPLPSPPINEQTT